ncbi:MAG TPA: hypothetical protein VFI27_20355 [candidate division Zixibacteria bacterium]|nr:hypothetical protein [candidate division Zixibacteria bacterium]
MDRRGVSKKSLLIALGAQAVANHPTSSSPGEGEYYDEPPKVLPIRRFDVVVAGGCPGGVFASTLILTLV